MFHPFINSMRAFPILGKRKERKRGSGNAVQPPVPKLQDAQLAAVYYDHRQGGDCFDFLRVTPTRVLFILLDVAGRIEDNREIVAAAQSVFRSTGARLFARDDANEADAMVEICLQLNRTILKTAARVCSSPAFAGCYNEGLGTVSYFNAGHTPGLLRDETQVIELPATGLPLGLFSHVTPDASIVALEPGDALVLVSRGIVEARRGREEFGLHRLKANLRLTLTKRAPEICRAILDGVQAFTQKPPRHNDVTVLALTRHPAARDTAADSVDGDHA
jgi:sigma-B regulation protein RsbU (phosphoserine phosphatase)